MIRKSLGAHAVGNVRVRYRQREGRTWWTVGAQKGVGQPPYVLKIRGRWYRTLPLTAPLGGEAMDDESKTAVEAMPVLDFGQRRCLDYLARAGKNFRELPLYRSQERRG